MIESLNKIKKTTIDLSTELGRNPTKQEIAYRLGISVSKLNQICKSAQSTISIETPANQKDDSTKIADYIVDESASTPDSMVTQENMLEDIQKMLKQLMPKERDVLIVGVKEDSKPFGFRSKTTGNIEGFDVDIARQIAKEILGEERKIKLVPVTPATRIESVTSGSVDMVIATMSITPQRQYLVDFSSPYYI